MIHEISECTLESHVKSDAVFLITFKGFYYGKASQGPFVLGAIRLGSYPIFRETQLPLHQGRYAQYAYGRNAGSLFPRGMRAGFWPASKDSPNPFFMPTPTQVTPVLENKRYCLKRLFYSPEMGEFFLKYEMYKNSKNPEATLHAFFKNNLYKRQPTLLNGSRLN